jgi:hypothetical protein
MLITSQAVSGAATMLPADMKPLNAPDAEACAVRGNQRAITEIAHRHQSRLRHAHEGPRADHHAKPPIANNAVASDHSTAYNGSARRAPSRCASIAAGI